MRQMLMPFIVATIISLVMTPIIRKYLIKYGIVDIPKDNRRMHKKPIPVAGGIAIYIATIISVIIFVGLNKSTIALIAGSTIIVVSGIIDDARGLSPKAKVLFQILAGICLVLGDVKIDFFTNPFNSQEQLIDLAWFSIPVTIFWVTGITNTINLIDGLDGLAAGVSMICSLSLMFIAFRFWNFGVAAIAAILAGSCLGFLPYNFNPAKIFMGDTGALFLGFVLSFISIEGVMKSAVAITIFLPVLILGVPIFDTTFAMVRRKLSGRSIASADKGHLHHRLLEMGLSQRQTVVVLYTISIVFGIVSNIVSTLDSGAAIAVSLLMLSVVAIGAIMFGMLKGKEE